ncbi:MAG: hydrogenase nickel incorporation protein HypB [Armatimonadetes bacterium]|nr:hydrogenase nickel incorporation protein HypB [Armatimonadota bacterium]
MQIPVVQKVLAANDLLASEMRAEFEKFGLFVVNIMGSPGAGKTSLIEQTLSRAGDLKIGVVEGDLATSLDAERIAKHGVPVVQINTGGACHLDASMVRKALDRIDVTSLDVLIIENVGNLVCPVSFDLGETARVVVCSIPEGDDKVLKYPAIFSSASVVVLNKIDISPYVSFDLVKFEESVANIGRRLIKISCSSGDGLENWMKWLRTRQV